MSTAGTNVTPHPWSSFGQVHDALTQPELPKGTVTLLFTEIEGSTRLLRRLGPELYAEALAAHRQMLRDAFAAESGVEIDTQGDAFFVAFPTASGAAIAARSGQLALTPGPITVRMGLHTGTPTVAARGYVGSTFIGVRGLPRSPTAVR